MSGSETRLSFAFEAEIWRHDGEGGWCFITLPAEVAAEIRAETDGPRRGFGAIRVEVRIGSSSWRTSIFPDPERGSFVLPLKKPVRRAEGIDAGDVVPIELQVVDESS